MARPRTSGEYQTFQFEPGGNATKKMRELFPWMSERQIQEYALPSFEDINYMMEDKDKVYPGINYEVEDFQKPLKRYPEDRDFSFGQTNIQSRATDMAREQDYQKALSTEEMDREYEREYQRVAGLNIFGKMMGINTGSMPTYRGAAGTTTKPTDPDDIADDLFVRELQKALKMSGGKLSRGEMTQLLDKTMAGPDQIKIMTEMIPLVDLGDMKEFYRLDDKNNLQYLYRFENDYGPEVFAAGWKPSLEGLKEQRAINKDKAAIVQDKKIMALNDTIANLVTIPAEGKSPDIKIPRSNAELLALERALVESGEITTTGEIAHLHSRFDHLKSPADKKWYTTVEDGKKTYHRMTPYEMETKNKKLKAEEKVLLTEVSADKVAAGTNTGMIDEVIGNTYRALVNGSPGDKVQRVPDVYTLGTQVFAALQGRTDIDTSDRAAINKQISDYLRTAEKEDHIESSNAIKIGKAFADITTAAGLRKFLSENPQIKGEQRTKFVNDFAKANPNLKYEGAKTLWDQYGKPAPVQIDSYEDYYKYKELFPFEDWEKVPFKPVTEINYREVDQNDYAWRAVGRVRSYDEKGKEIITEVDEDRYTLGTEKKLADQYRSSQEFKDAVKSINLITENTDKILVALTAETGTLDGFTIKFIEKMLDPTGVVRASDVEFIQQFGDQLEAARQLLKKVKNMSDSTMISTELRRDFAFAVTEVFKAVMRSNTQILQDVRARWDVDADVMPGQYGGKIDFNRVMPQLQWDRYANYGENIAELKKKFDDAIKKKSGKYVPSKVGDGNPVWGVPRGGQKIPVVTTPVTRE